MDNLELKITITRMKSSLEGLNNRLELLEKRTQIWKYRLCNHKNREEREWSKMYTVSEKHETPLSAPTYM